MGDAGDASVPEVLADPFAVPRALDGGAVEPDSRRPEALEIVRDEVVAEIGDGRLGPGLFQLRERIVPKADARLQSAGEGAGRGRLPFRRTSNRVAPLAA